MEASPAVMVPASEVSPAVTVPAMVDLCRSHFAPASESDYEINDNDDSLKIRKTRGFWNPRGMTYYIYLCIT